jgi:hypothetical protein
MFHPICVTCGTQFESELRFPHQCPICTDERQYVGWKGQQWTTLSELSSQYSNRLEQDDGIFAIGMSPGFAIDQRALLLTTSSIRILWESVSLVTPEAVEAIQARGGVDLIAISHPHFYSSMVEWSEALGGVPIYLHEADQQWIGRHSPNIELWRGDEHRLSSGVTLLRCGGHFPGSTALHWQDAACAKGQLFPGDALQVVRDRRHVSFMYSYPNYVPMHPNAVRHIRELLEPYAFEDVFGYTWGRNIIGGARAAVDRSFERHLTAIGAAA